MLVWDFYFHLWMRNAVWNMLVCVFKLCPLFHSANVKSPFKGGGNKFLSDTFPFLFQSIAKYFIERVRANLHVVLCMSPIGDPFRDRLRMYPAFVNCTTIDWFSEWPMDALLEVATKYLSTVSLLIGDEEVSSLLRLPPPLLFSYFRLFSSIMSIISRI